MNKASYGDRDPIAAVATVPGQSALAVIRTSGATSIELTASVFSRPLTLKKSSGNTVVHGWINDPLTKKKIDEVLICVYRSPKSFTGEDSADISCHGGIASVKAIMSVLKSAGFREALPGEFSFRSFMNGKTDLTRAESVMELVSAKTNRAREQAVRRLNGVFYDEVSEVKNLLVKVLAGAEIYLDYSEDEFTGTADDESSGKLPDMDIAESALAKLKCLSELWQHERIYAEGALAVIAGRPNAGKSSLFNCLVREDRSIVTDIPGTTRDWIEALISVEDIPLRLIDTAGLRIISGLTHDESDPELMGIQRSFELLESADLVLYVIDGTAGIGPEDRNFINSRTQKPLIIVWNKADLAKPMASLPERLKVPGNEKFPKLLAVSAKTGEGIADLLHSVADILEKSEASANPDLSEMILSGNAAGPGTARQKELIDNAIVSVEEALAMADHLQPLELIAPLLRAAVDALGEITGEVSNADVLEVMFSRFCVGK